VNEVAAVVVTYNALPWLEQCLESVRGVETVVVDHGSTDGTLELVRARFPDVELVEQENRGLAFGWNTGVERTSGRYVLLLNSDAWLDAGALDALVALAEARADAAVVGPRLRYPDGRLQRSVRGFPTLWRLATEFFFLRRLAPRTRAFNAFYGGGFAHDAVHEAEVLMGAVWLVRRAAIDEVGPADDAFFLFSEETDWAWRFRAAGWKLLFTPDAGATHVYAASHKGRLFVENLRGQLRFLRKHRGEGYAERARRLLLAALWLRGALFRGERGRMYREGASWLGSGGLGELLTRPRLDGGERK
jgi:N-acetylglucosaminyl-diphospho-decaprenol L-rhamnosyltransferase